ncbi:hypothetical protein DV738_g5583, partial [Chaetothyriales sp. CBS 135597]
MVANTVVSPPNTTSYVVADYSLGAQFGKLTYADFILDQFHVLLLFDMAPHASILSLTGPQREDIASIKFSGEQGVAVSPSGKTQALLLRPKGQDHVVILSHSANEIQIQSNFVTNTVDAQGIAFSPDGDPVIAVWDAAAHGTRISFFTVLGHSLKQLDVGPSPEDHVLPGVGVSALQLVASDEGVILAFAHGEKELSIRYQHHKTMTIRQLISLKHPNVIDGASAIVWQQVNPHDRAFHLEKGAFDAVAESARGPAQTRISFNADQSFLVTTVADNASTLWLWQPDHPDVHTVIVFYHNIRQVAWHPRNPSVLIIVTAQQEPSVYVWYAETKPPVQCVLPLDNVGSAKLEVEWLVREGEIRSTMASARPITAREGELERFFYRKAHLIHVELPAAVEAGVDAKEVDEYRRQIAEVMPPVLVPAKENNNKTHAQGVRIAHIRLSHICGRLVRSASQVHLEKAKLELVKGNDAGIRLEDIQRYRDEILGGDFSRAPSDSCEEQWQQFRNKIREAVATIRAKIPTREDKDMVEKSKPLRFSDILDIDDIDNEEFDETPAFPSHTPFCGSATGLAHDFDAFSVMTGWRKQAAEGYYRAGSFQDPPLPSMPDEESSSETLIPSSESFIPSSDPFDFTCDTFIADCTDSDPDDVQPNLKLRCHLTEEDAGEGEEEGEEYEEYGLF